MLITAAGPNKCEEVAACCMHGDLAFSSHRASLVLSDVSFVFQSGAVQTESAGAQRL